MYPAVLLQPDIEGDGGKMSIKNKISIYPYRHNASVTVFAAMSLMLVVSVIGVLIEGARCQGARVMLAMAADMALDSMFSGFERELLDKYGVLFFDGADGKDTLDKQYISDTLKEKIRDSLDMDKALIFTKGADFYGIEVDDVDVTGVLNATDAFGLIWRKSVNDYVKIDYPLKLIESLLGMESVENENKTVQEASNILDNCMEQASGFYEKYLKLIEHIDGIKTQSNGINFDKLKSRDMYVKSIGPGGSTDITQDNMSINDYRIYEKVNENVVDIYAFGNLFLGKFSAALKKENLNIKEVKELGNVTQNFFKSLKNELEESIKLVEEIKSDSNILTEKIVCAAEYLSSITQISEQSLKGLRENLESVEEEQKNVLKRLGDVDAMCEALKNNYVLVSNAYNCCPDMSFIKDNGTNIDDAVVVYEKYKKAFELLSGYRTDSMWLDYTGIACRDEDESILGCLYDYSANGMLALVLPSGTEVSKKTLGNLELADLYGIRGDRNEYIEDAVADFMNEALFNIYLTECFDNYIDNDGKGAIDYEQEYIMFGKSSDEENLKAAIMSIAGIRLGCNMTYILTDTQKKSEAMTLAMTALGFTGMAALVKGLQYVILTAWAVGETIVDMKMLLAGKKVPVLKKKGEWKLALENLIAGKLDISEDDKNGDGLSYGQYLMAVMLLENPQEKSFRSMALVEMYMISQGVDNFRLKNYIYGLDISVSYHLKGNKEEYTYKCSYTY